MTRLFTNSTRSGHKISLPDHFDEDAHDANEEDEIDYNGRDTRDFVDPIQLRILHPTTEKRNKNLIAVTDARKKVQAEIVDLKEKVKIAKETIIKFKSEINKCQTGGFSTTPTKFL